MNRPGRLEITTKIGCSCNCHFCPQDKLLRGYLSHSNTAKAEINMSYETFKTCIDKLPMSTRIDFSGMAEPWLNSDCTRMVLYAHEKGYPIAIYTTLVGMKQEDFEQIKDILFDEFVVHVPDDKNYTHIKITDEYLELLKRVVNYRQKNGNFLVTGYSCHANLNAQVMNIIPDNSKIITNIIDRAGNIDDNDAEKKNNVGDIVCINCGTGMNDNVLLPDGTVLLCCMDYGMQHVLGNLLNQTYDEIMNGNEVKKIIHGLKEGNSGILCRKCVNGKGISEITDEYFKYKDWSEKLEKQYNTRMKELGDYKNWVKSLEGQLDYYKGWSKKLEGQYNDRLKELNDYINWVKNLECQIADLKQTKKTDLLN